LEELSSWEERSFPPESESWIDSLRSLPEMLGAGRIRILIGCVERSFPTRSEPSVVAMLLRTDSLIGCEERSFDSLRSLRIRILIGCVVNNKTPSPLCFS
jgi:hypothetical protein